MADNTHPNADRFERLYLNPGMSLDDQKDMLTKMIDPGGERWHKRTEPFARVITITPPLAYYIISELKRLNRKTSSLKIKKYANAMKAGDWFGLTGQPIIFSRSGVLLDGYHRLPAVIQAGKNLRILSVFGVEEDAFSFLDIGRRKTNANTLEALGVPNAGVVSRAIRWLMILSSDNPLDRAFSPENEEIRALWEDRYQRDALFTEAVHLAIKVNRVKNGRFPPGPLAALFYLYGSAGVAQWNKVQDFAHGMLAEKARARSNPAKLVRTVTTRLEDVSGRLHENVRNVMIARALAKHLTGGTLGPRELREVSRDTEYPKLPKLVTSAPSFIA
jgi:hypothetical protein